MLDTGSNMLFCLTGKRVEAAVLWLPWRQSDSERLPLMRLFGLSLHPVSSCCLILRGWDDIFNGNSTMEMRR